MNKQEAMKRLEVMQKEMDQLKAIIQKPDEPEIFQGRYLREGLGREHWCLGINGNCHVFNGSPDNSSKLGLCFATEEVVKQHREHLRLIQEARVAMAKSWGAVKVDWTDGDQYKYVITICVSEPYKATYGNTYSTIHFRTEDDRDQFFSAYSEDELKLMIMGVQ